MSKKTELEQKAKDLGLEVKRRDGEAGDPTIADFEYAIGVAEGALVPDDAPTGGEKAYRVVGAQEVLGHPPASEFVAELEPWQEKTLVEGGHLEIVESKEA